MERKKKKIEGKIKHPTHGLFKMKQYIKIYSRDFPLPGLFGSSKKNFLRMIEITVECSVLKKGSDNYITVGYYITVASY